MLNKNLTKAVLRKQYQSMASGKTKGINVHNLKKDELIKLIQKTEGNSPCFKGSFASSCGQIDCAWYNICKK
jgi:hypothetical protein